MAAIAAIGVVETAYLTIAKFTTGSVICPTSGCDKVLNSPYATVFGTVPLSLLGCLAYLSIAILALAPKAVNPNTNKGLHSQLENKTWQALFIITAAMVIFSSYLMYLMAFEIQELCIYCITSALFSLSLFVLVLVGREWEDIGQLVFTGILVAMVSSIGALGLYNSVTSPPPLSLPPELHPLPSLQPPARHKLLWSATSEKSALKSTALTGVPTATTKKCCSAKKLLP